MGGTNSETRRHPPSKFQHSPTRAFPRHAQRTKLAGAASNARIFPPGSVIPPRTAPDRKDETRDDRPPAMLGVHGHGLMDPAAVFQQGFHAPPTPRQNNRLTSRRPPSSRGRDDSSETDGSSHRVAHTLTACCRCRQVSCRRPAHPASTYPQPP